MITKTITASSASASSASASASASAMTTATAASKSIERKLLFIDLKIKENEDEYGGKILSRHKNGFDDFVAIEEERKRFKHERVLSNAEYKIENCLRGTLMFILCTCASEGLDVWRFQEYFQRLTKFGVNKCGIDIEGVYDNNNNNNNNKTTATSIAPVHLISASFCSNNSAAKKYFHGLCQVLEILVDAGADVDETYQIQSMMMINQSICSIPNGTIGNCLFFLSIAISSGSEIGETLRAMEIVVGKKHGRAKECDANIKCYIPERSFDHQLYDDDEEEEEKEEKDEEIERHRSFRYPQGDYISALQYLTMSLYENASCSFQIRENISLFCLQMIQLCPTIALDDECTFYAQNDLSKFEIMRKRLAFDFIESQNDLPKGSLPNACNALQPKGSALFFAGIAIMEGCGDPAFRVCKLLLEYGASPNCFGDFPMIGTETPLVSLALYASLDPSGWNDSSCVHFFEKPWWRNYYDTPVPMLQKSRRPIEKNNDNITSRRNYTDANDDAEIIKNNVDRMQGKRDTISSYKNTKQRTKENKENFPAAAALGTNIIANNEEKLEQRRRQKAVSFVDQIQEFFSEPRRGVRAKKQSMELFQMLLDYGANPSTEWKRVPRLHIDDVTQEHRTATLISIAIEDTLCFVDHGKRVLEMLIKKGADLSMCGLGPFPVYCTPCFAACAAVRYGHPDAEYMYALFSNDNISARKSVGFFPGGSQSTALIELIRCVGESKSKKQREKALVKIEALLNAGADANEPCLDAFLSDTPTAYADILNFRVEEMQSKATSKASSQINSNADSNNNSDSKTSSSSGTPLFKDESRERERKHQNATQKRKKQEAEDDSLGGGQQRRRDSIDAFNRSDYDDDEYTFDVDEYDDDGVEEEDNDDLYDEDEVYSSNGYTRFYDSYYEMYYYVDEATGASDWMKPKGFIDPKEKRIRPPPLTANNISQTRYRKPTDNDVVEYSDSEDEEAYDQGFKSNNWVRWFDRSEGLYYYFNEITYDVQWEEPEDFNEFDLAKVTKSPLAARAVSDADVARSLREKMDLEAKAKKIDEKAAQLKENKRRVSFDNLRNNDDLTKSTLVTVIASSSSSSRDYAKEKNETKTDEDANTVKVRTSVSANKFRTATTKQPKLEISFPIQHIAEPIGAATNILEESSALPKTIDRLGTCTFSPLFIAMDCLEGDGHEVVAKVVRILLDYGADVEYEQGRNLRSWYEGSLIAMSIQVAISCGSPIPEVVNASQTYNDCSGQNLNKNFRANRSNNYEEEEKEEEEKERVVLEQDRGRIHLEQHIPTIETSRSMNRCDDDNYQSNSEDEKANEIARLGAINRKNFSKSESHPRHWSYDKLKKTDANANRMNEENKVARTTVIAQTVYESSQLRLDAPDLHKKQADDAREKLRLEYPIEEEKVDEQKNEKETTSFWNVIAKAIGFEDSDDDNDDDDDVHDQNMSLFFDHVFGFEDDLREYTLNTFEEAPAKYPLSKIDYGIDDRGSLKVSEIKMQKFRNARFESATSVAKMLISQSSAKALNKLCRNPLLGEYGTDLVPFEFTPFFAACFGAATAESDDQVRLGIELAREILAKGADCTIVGRHAQDSTTTKSTAIDYAKSIEARTAPFVWAVTASARCPDAKFGGLKLVKQCLSKGANPLLCELETSRYPNGRGMTISNNPSKLLNLWDDKKFLDKMPPKQRREAIASRIELGRLLGEASTLRSVFTKLPAKKKTTTTDTLIKEAKKECKTGGKWGLRGGKNHGVTQRHSSNGIENGFEDEKEDNDEGILILNETKTSIEQSAAETTKALMKALTSEEAIFSLSEDLSKLNASINKNANKIVPGIARGTMDRADTFQSGQMQAFYMGDLQNPVLGAPKRFAQVAVLAREASLNKKRLSLGSSQTTTVKNPLFSAMSASFVSKVVEKRKKKKKFWTRASSVSFKDDSN